MLFTEKAKIVDRGYQSCALESTDCKLQYEPYLFSVACSQKDLSISEKFGRSGKGSFTEKGKIVDRGSICSAPEGTVSKLQYEPFLFPVA